VFQKDYLMRLIQQFIQGLIQVLTKRESGEIREAVDDLGEMYHSYLGLDRATIAQMTDHQLLSLFGGEENIGLDKCLMIAELFYSETQMASSDSDKYTMRALRFYLLAMKGTDMWDDSPAFEHFQELLSTIQFSDVPVELLKQLEKFLHRIGDEKNEAKVEELIASKE